MSDRRKDSRFPLGSLVGIAAAVFVAGAGAAWWAVHTLTTSRPTPEPTPTPITVSPTPTPASSPNAQQPSLVERAQVYWLSGSGGTVKLAAVPVLAQKSASDRDVLETALERLLEGSQSATYTTTIPAGTKLLSLKLAKDGIHLDLSQAFTTGGGSESMIERLAQLLYTATSLDPKARVWIDVEGQPLEVLGGEGLMVDRPMTRQEFEENFQL